VQQQQQTRICCFAPIPIFPQHPKRSQSSQSRNLGDQFTCKGQVQVWVIIGVIESKEEFHEFEKFESLTLII
jgi:hypothetical protein